MTLSSIGLIQGRLFPKYIDQLQVFPDKTWKKEINILREIGFDYIELLWDKKKSIKQIWEIQDQILLHSKIQAHSICLDSITFKNTSNSIINEIDDVIRTFGKKTPSILVIPLLSKAGINSFGKLKDFIANVNMHNVMKSIKEYNIKLAIEIDMPSSHVLDALNFDKSGLIGVCIDSGNLWNYSESPTKDILTLSEKVIHVHIKDKDSIGNNVMLGKGLVKFNEFFKALIEIGYSKNMTLETKYFKDPIVEAKNNLQYILAILSKL